MLVYSAHPNGGTAVITPPAEIDLTNAEQLQNELDTALDRRIVDMSRTTFCDSAGATVLLGAHKRASLMHADLRLIIRAPIVRRIFEINGMDEILQIYPTLDAAQHGIAEHGKPLTACENFEPRAGLYLDPGRLSLRSPSSAPSPGQAAGG